MITGHDAYGRPTVYPMDRPTVGGGNSAWPLTAPYMPVHPDINDLVDRTPRYGLTGDDVPGHHDKPWKFCPHCGERLEAAGAPFWNPEPLYNTNEARVREAEDDGGEL